MCGTRATLYTGGTLIKLASSIIYATFTSWTHTQPPVFRLGLLLLSTTLRRTQRGSVHIIAWHFMVCHSTARASSFPYTHVWAFPHESIHCTKLESSCHECVAMANEFCTPLTVKSSEIVGMRVNSLTVQYSRTVSECARMWICNYRYGATQFTGTDVVRPSSRKVFYDWYYAIIHTQCNFCICFLDIQ